MPREDIWFIFRLNADYVFNADDTNSDRDSSNNGVSDGLSKNYNDKGNHPNL